MCGKAGMNNHFDPEKYYDHNIVDDEGAVVGHIVAEIRAAAPADFTKKSWRTASHRPLTPKLCKLAAIRRR